MLSATNSAAQDQPTIQKDSVQVTAFTLSSYKKDFKVFSWVPKLNLRVNGPIASGSQIYAEFTAAGGSAWKFDCKTEETGAGHWWQVEDCGGRDALGEDKGTTYTGPVNFTIKMRNELMGGDATLFSGKFKVAKVHSNETGPNYVNHFVYYVDQDWNLPQGSRQVDVPGRGSRQSKLWHHRDRRQPNAYNLAARSIHLDALGM